MYESALKTLITNLEAFRTSFHSWLDFFTIVTMDLRVLKYFPFGETRHLDVVAEPFNLFNRANVAQIKPVFGSNLIPVAGFGEPTEGVGARQVQFSLDFEF